MTSQSITRTACSSTSWADQDNASHRKGFPDRPRITTDPIGRLMDLRRQQLDICLRSLAAKGRVPRVGLYALTVDGRSPARSMEDNRLFAEREGWRVGREQKFNDDRLGLTDLGTRPGGTRMKAQVKSGFADGVVVLTQSVISGDLERYERELAWFATAVAFIAVVYPEVSL